MLFQYIRIWNFEKTMLQKSMKFDGFPIEILSFWLRIHSSTTDEWIRSQNERISLGLWREPRPKSDIWFFENEPELGQYQPDLEIERTVAHSKSWT